MSSKRKDSHPSRATSGGSAPLGINSTVITKVIKVNRHPPLKCQQLFELLSRRNTYLADI
jgi:hypothetical protein